jgi:hypothetical protein
MPSFSALLRAETRKARNSFVVWLTVLGTLGNMLIFAVLSWFNLGDHAFGTGQTDWEVYVLNHYDGIAFLMLPLFVIILATLLQVMEHRAGTWALLMSLPSSRGHVYLSKLVFGLLLFVVAHLLFIVGFLFSGLLLGVLRADLSLALLDFPLVLVLVLATKTVLSILALFALHLWLGLRFPQFIIPLTIGILGFVLSSLLSPAFPYQWLNPYAYPICYMPHHHGAITLPTLGFWSLHDGMSVFWAILLGLGGVADLRRMAIV